MASPIKNEKTVSVPTPPLKAVKQSSALEKYDSILIEQDKKAGLSFKDKWFLRRSPTLAYLVTIHFSNGTTRTFVVRSRSETFEFKRRMYYLRKEDGWYDLTHNQMHLHYWDDCPTPIRNVIKKEGDDRWFSVTPENLKPLIRMEYVKVLATSHEINKFLKAILAITMFAGVITLGVGILSWQIYQKIGG